MDRSKIVEVLRSAYAAAESSLEVSRKTGAAFAKHRDWPWNGIILSGATRGGSKRWTGVQARYEQELSWNCLAPLSDSQRHERLLSVGRYKNKTADWLEAVFTEFKSGGGPWCVKTRLEPMSAYEVIAFWCSFSGMGDKYARNIMMDANDVRFRTGFFAIDSRISSLLKSLGYFGPAKYAAQERFLNELAAALEIDSWPLDRLLYQKTAELREALLAIQGGNIVQSC